MEKTLDKMQDKRRFSSKRPQSSELHLDRNVNSNALCMCQDPRLVCPILSHRSRCWDSRGVHNKLTTEHHLPQMQQKNQLDLAKIGNSGLWQTSYQSDFKPIDSETLRTIHELDTQLESSIHLENSASHLSDPTLIPHKSLVKHVPAKVEEVYEKPVQFIKLNQEDETNSKIQLSNVSEYNRVFKPYRRREFSADLKPIDSISVADKARPLIHATDLQKQIFTQTETKENSLARDHNRKINQFDSLNYELCNPDKPALSHQNIDLKVPIDQRLSKHKVRPTLPSEFSLMAPYMQFDESVGLWKIRPEFSKHSTQLNY